MNFKRSNSEDIRFKIWIQIWILLMCEIQILLLIIIACFVKMHEAIETMIKNGKKNKIFEKDKYNFYWSYKKI